MQAIGVLEQVLGAGYLVAPLDERELGRRRHRRKADIGDVGRLHLGGEAGVDVLVELRPFHTDLDAVHERWEGARRHTAEAAAGAALGPGKGQRGDCVADESQAVSGRADEERSGRVRADVGDLHRHDLTRQVEGAALFAAAHEVLARRRIERVVYPPDPPGRNERDRDANAVGLLANPDRRRATRLVRRDGVRTRRGGDHVRQGVLLPGGRDLVGESRLSILAQQDLAVLEDGDLKRVPNNAPRRRAGRAVRGRA